jgi:hypothetical protein
MSLENPNPNPNLKEQLSLLKPEEMQACKEALKSQLGEIDDYTHYTVSPRVDQDGSFHGTITEFSFPEIVSKELTWTGKMGENGTINIQTT